VQHHQAVKVLQVVMAQLLLDKVLVVVVEHLLLVQMHQVLPLLVLAVLVVHHQSQVHQ
jgi:hypothetical protein